MPDLIRLPGLPSSQVKRSRKKPKPLRWPAGEAMHYGARLLEVVRETERVITYFLIPALDGLQGQAQVFLPVRADDAASELESIMERLRVVVPLTDERAAQLAVEMLQRVQTNHGTQFIEAYDGILPINPFMGDEAWLPAQMSLRAKENVGLIKSLPAELLADVEGLVTRELLKGTHSTTIADMLRERYDVAENRALLIATDQTGKWFGSLNKYRQLDANVDEYEWLTAGDGAVRPSHQALNGKKRKWGEGVEPGQEVRCRCQPIPVIPEFEEE